MVKKREDTRVLSILHVEVGTSFFIILRAKVQFTPRGENKNESEVLQSSVTSSLISVESKALAPKIAFDKSLRNG